VSQSLGREATQVSESVNVNVTFCWRKIEVNARANYVRSLTGGNGAGLQNDVTAVEAERKDPKSDSKFARYRVFSNSIGSLGHRFTYSVIILKRSLNSILARRKQR